MPDYAAQKQTCDGAYLNTECGLWRLHSGLTLMIPETVLVIPLRY
jgi:hypothetical protein